MNARSCNSCYPSAFKDFDRHHAGVTVAACIQRRRLHEDVKHLLIDILAARGPVQTWEQPHLPMKAIVQSSHSSVDSAAVPHFNHIR